MKKSNGIMAENAHMSFFRSYRLNTLPDTIEPTMYATYRRVRERFSIPLEKPVSLQIGMMKSEKQLTIAAYTVPVMTVPESAIIQALTFLFMKTHYP